MQIKTEQFPCNFVGTFKVGDNLVYNAKLLCNLLEANNDGIFNKLIVLQVSSILEAALSEIIFRAQNYNVEGVPNISEKDRAEIKDKKIDKFNQVIDVLKKYNVLNGCGEEIYDELHTLRKYRNKVHIQDDIPIAEVSRDEVDAFSVDVSAWALRINVRIVRYLVESLPRPEALHRYVGNLTLPVV